MYVCRWNALQKIWTKSVPSLPTTQSMFSPEQMEFLHALNNKFLPPLDMAADDYNDNDIDNSNFFSDMLSEDSPLHSTTTAKPHTYIPEMNRTIVDSNTKFNDHSIMPSSGYPDTQRVKKKGVQLGNSNKKSDQPKKSASELLSELMQKGNGKTPLVLPPLKALLPPQQYESNEVAMSQPMKIADPFSNSSSSSSSSSNPNPTGSVTMMGDNNHFGNDYQSSSGPATAMGHPIEDLPQRNSNMYSNQQHGRHHPSSSSLNNARKSTQHRGILSD